MYNYTCIKYCTPEIAANNPSCYSQSSTCTPSVRILNKPTYFLMDGTNLKLNLNVTDCGLLTFVKWKSSLNENSLIIHNQGKSLYVDASELTIPMKQYFDVFLYDYNQTTILSQDSVEIDFVSTSINGGKISSFFFNQTIIFSIDVFHQIVTPRLNGTVNYVWQCPAWVPFETCNQRSNRPIIKVDGNLILQEYFLGDLLYDVSVKVLVDKVEYVKMIGFCIVYTQRNLTSFFDFTISNMTQIGYNLPLKHRIDFVNDIDREALKNDLTIKWNINRTDIELVNRDALPVFIVNPESNSYGGYNVTCQLTYRKGTKVETTFQKNTVVYINPPPLGGEFKVVPNTGIFTDKFKLSVEGLRANPEAFISSDYVIHYQYFYLNPSNEYVLIENMYDLGEVYRPRLIPPTTYLKVRVHYDPNSFVDYV
jgi:hypothetical protein